MATNFAIQPSVYESVSRANRQRRAVGRREDERTAYSAYRSALDTSAARALQAKAIDIREQQENRRLEILDESRRDQARADTVSGGVSLVQTGVQLYDKIAPHLATETASQGGQTAISGTAAVGGQTAITEGTSAVSSAEAGHIATSGTGYTATSTGPTVGGSLAAGSGVTAVELTKGEMGKWAQDTFGGEAEDVVNVGARVGEGAMIGASIGGGYGAAIGAVAGAILGVGEAIADGSHLCTATHREYDNLYVNEMNNLKILKDYTNKNHSKELKFYLANCPEVLDMMNKEEKYNFFLGFRHTVIPTLSNLIDLEEPEMAYQLYRNVTRRLFEKYMPNFKERFAEKVNG